MMATQLALVERGWVGLPAEAVEGRLPALHHEHEDELEIISDQTQLVLQVVVREGVGNTLRRHPPQHEQHVLGPHGLALDAQAQALEADAERQDVATHAHALLGELALHHAVVVEGGREVEVRHGRGRQAQTPSDVLLVRAHLALGLIDEGRGLSTSPDLGRTKLESSLGGCGRQKRRQLQAAVPLDDAVAQVIQAEQILYV